MQRIVEYYIGKPCKMDIGVNGEICWAVGRIVGKAEAAVEWEEIFKHPSVIEWSTPHGSVFESGFFYLYELDKNDQILLKEFEKEAKKDKNVKWYDARLNKISYEVLKLE